MIHYVDRLLRYYQMKRADRERARLEALILPPRPDPTPPPPRQRCHPGYCPLHGGYHGSSGVRSEDVAPPRASSGIQPGLLSGLTPPRIR